MREAFTSQLTELAASMATMCSTATDLMELATHGLLQADLAAAEKVISREQFLIEQSKASEELGYSLLALQAPVATDLRQVVSSIQLIQDISRMGSLALHVAKITRRRHPEHVIPEPVSGYFAEMGRVAVGLGRSATEVLLTRDLKQAAGLAEQDDAMDDLRRHLFTLLTVREWTQGVAAAVDVTLLGRYYERFCDHAVEVAQRVIFLTTGKSADSLNADVGPTDDSSRDEIVSAFENRQREFERRFAEEDKNH